jgi:hypothetical protein
MAISKRTDATGSKIAHEPVRPVIVSVTRSGFAMLAALIVVPWVVAAVTYYQHGRGTSPVEAVNPAPPPSAAANAGPWGHLEVSPIIVSPPLEYVSDDWGREEDGPDHWRFPGVSPEQLDAFLQTCGFSRDQTARIVASAKADPSTGGLVVTPDAELVRSLGPDVRARLYSQLAKTPLNFDQANSFRFFGDSPEQWLAGSPISPEARRIVEPLIYRDGAFLHFADTELVRSQIKDPGELRRVAKTLLRQPTMLVRLSVRDASEVSRLAEYWGRGGRRTDLRPLLESVAGAGPDHSIDIIHLLPSFARNHLYRYPQLTAGALNQSLLANCLWSALNFFNGVADDRFLEVPVALETLKRDYFIVHSGFVLGDVIAFLDEDGDLFHVAVYLADDLVFSKNGTSPVSPWIIMPLERVKGYYRARSSNPRLIYHRHSKY